MNSCVQLLFYVLSVEWKLCLWWICWSDSTGTLLNVADPGYEEAAVCIISNKSVWKRADHFSCLAFRISIIIVAFSILDGFFFQDGQPSFVFIGLCWCSVFRQNVQKLIKNHKLTFIPFKALRQNVVTNFLFGFTMPSLSWHHLRMLCVFTISTPCPSITAWIEDVQ